VTRKRVGLKEVAAIAGTSVATVSRVLSGTGYASDAMRARVTEAAATLDYQPNLRARALQQRASYTVGLIIPNLLNAYYTALADALSQLLTEAGYSLLLASSRDDAGIERDIVLDMVRHDVAGLLWVPAAPATDLLDTLRTHGVPAVSLVRRIEGDPIDAVVFEDFQGSAAAAHHLLDLGHRRLGYVGCDEHSSNRARWAGFRDAAASAGIVLDGDQIKLGRPCESWGSRAAQELLAAPLPPTAIYAASNALMPGVLRAVRETGVVVPDELSLICFDDVDWFSYTFPAVTAVRVSYVKLAETAVGLLLRRVRDLVDPEAPPRLVEVGYRLMARQSTGSPPPGDDRPRWATHLAADPWAAVH
jgi:LacI family transcriptional regulator